jgi:hypothetical protein
MIIHLFKCKLFENVVNDYSTSFKCKLFENVVNDYLTSFKC